MASFLCTRQIVMRKIQDKDWLYDLCRPYVEGHFRLAYRCLEYAGRENIPTDGAVIFAPNHVNGLQDAIAVVGTDHKPKVFVARADMFRIAWLAPLLRRAKIMPINRIRDGVENVRRNDAVMEEAVSVLADGVAFCIMPEATHRPKHSLLPLAKGVFRIARLADERLAGTKPVYLVPVGLEFGSYFRFRSTLLVNIGTPIDVTAFFRTNAALPLPQAYNQLSERLTEAMRDLILYIPEDAPYDALLEACYLRDFLPFPSCPEVSGYGLMARLQTDQAVVETLLQLQAVSPGKAALLLEHLDEIARIRKDARICVASVQCPQAALRRVVTLREGLLVLASPWFVFSALATIPMWTVLAGVFAGLEDRAFLNSLRCGFAMLRLPLWYMVLVLLVSSWLTVGWTILCVLCFLPSHVVFYEWLRHFQRLVSDVRLLHNRLLRAKISELRRRL